MEVIRQLLEKVLDMSIAGAFVILAVIVLRFLCRRLPKGFSYTMWTAAAFRLLCPVSVASVISLFNLPLFQADPAQPAIAAEDAGITYLFRGIGITDTPSLNLAVQAPVGAGGTGAAGEAAASAEGVLPFICALIWIAGIFAGLVYFVISCIKIRRQSAFAVRFEAGSRVYLCEGLRTPFLFGIFRPRIYIPYGLDEKSRTYILRHEQYHIAHLDHIVKLLAMLLLAVHWFNPLVWLAYYLMNSDMEMRCDENVIAALGAEQKADYSRTLLSFVKPKAFIAGISLGFGGNQTKRRILNVLHFHRPRKWIAAAAAGGCLCLIAVCVTNPIRIRSNPGASQKEFPPFAPSATAGGGPVNTPNPSAAASPTPSSDIGSARPDRTPTAGTPEGGSTVPPTPTQKPEVLSQKHRAFTETEAFIDEMYHGLFPERTDYIAYWTDEGKMFWAPDIENLFPSHSYTMYSGVEYEIIANGETNLFLFVEPQSQPQPSIMILYCGCFSADENERIGQRYERGTFTTFDYKLFEKDGRLYFAIISGSVKQGWESWYSCILSADLMEEVWSIREMYPNPEISEERENCWYAYKEVINGNSFDIYYSPEPKMRPDWVFVKSAAFEELIPSLMDRKLAD